MTNVGRFAILLLCGLAGCGGADGHPTGSSDTRPAVAAPTKATNDPSSPLSLAELRRRGVLGEMGVPLGKVFEIEAKVIAGRDLNVKGYRSIYLLEIASVAGEPLETAKLMRFHALPWANVKLPNDPFDLYETKHHQRAASLNTAEMEELERGYLGVPRRLLVYEVGGFHGRSDDAARVAGEWADVAFGFHTSLVVAGQPETK